MENTLKITALSAALMLASTSTYASLGGSLGGGTSSGGYSSSAVYGNCSSAGDPTAGAMLGGSLANNSGGATMDCANEDTDGDFMQNTYELTYSLNKNDASDAYGDADGDGSTNQREAAFGTEADNTDTDGDGLNDLEDPDPTDIGVTERALDNTYKGGKVTKDDLDS